MGHLRREVGPAWAWLGVLGMRAAGGRRQAAQRGGVYGKGSSCHPPTHQFVQRAALAPGRTQQAGALWWDTPYPPPPFPAPSPFPNPNVHPCVRPRPALRCPPHGNAGSRWHSPTNNTPAAAQPRRPAQPRGGAWTPGRGRGGAVRACVGRERRERGSGGSGSGGGGRQPAPPGVADEDLNFESKSKPCCPQTHGACPPAVALYHM